MLVMMMSVAEGIIIIFMYVCMDAIYILERMIFISTKHIKTSMQMSGHSHVKIVNSSIVHQVCSFRTTAHLTCIHVYV